jgi:dTDP-4-amino-4,6-dideoxygalactose transaminase
MTVFSFHPVKIITTGEGGAVLTNDPVIAARLERLRSHGITRDPSLMIGESEGQWYYQQLELGYNYRVTDIQAALGLSQLDRLADFVECRHAIADRYDALLQELPVDLPGRLTEASSSWHLYVLRLQQAADHLSVFQSLRSDGIGVNLHYIPIHLQPYYQQLGFRRGDYPVSEDYYSRAISLPIYPDLDEASQLRVVAALERAILS